MEDTPGDAFRRLQEILEQMIREGMEQGNTGMKPMGFTIIIRGSGPFPGGMPVGQGGSSLERDGTFEPLIEVHEGEEEVLVFAELPGISADQVRLDFDEGSLRICASDGTREFLGRAEIPPVDAASLEAGCRNGVLEVRLRRIPGPVESRDCPGG